jgi:hypothetical protein
MATDAKKRKAEAEAIPTAFTAGDAASETIPRCAVQGLPGNGLQASVPHKPSWTPLAPGHEVMASTYMQMQSIIPYVLSHLPARVGLGAEDDLAKAMPLEITKDAASAGYKEVWNPTNCKSSIAVSNLYEAGGSLFWLDTQLSSAGSTTDPLIREEPPWLSITDLASQFFSKASLERGVGGQAAGVSAAGCFVFPLALDAYASDASQLDTKGRPKKIDLVSGHALVWAWYYATACALHASDAMLIRKLYHCALSATIRVRVLADSAAVTLLSIRCSETYVGAEKGLADSFLVWAEKALSVVDSRQSSAKVASEMDGKGVTYAGAKVSKQMVLAAQAVVSVMTARSRLALQAIERCYGRGVIGNSYAKLQGIARMSKMGTTAEVAQELASFALGGMFLALHLKQAPPKFFTVEAMEKSKRDGSPGWFHMTVAKRLMVKHILHCVACLAAESDSTKQIVADRFLPAFHDPMAFYDKFCIHATARYEENEDGAATEAPAADDEDAAMSVATFSVGMPKFAEGAAEILYAIYIPGSTMRTSKRLRPKRMWQRLSSGALTREGTLRSRSACASGCAPRLRQRPWCPPTLPCRCRG